MGVPARQVEALPATLNGAERAFLVWKRRPLSDLPLWKRSLIRFVYFVAEWSTGDGIEFQAIITDEELAKDLASRPGWAVHELPVNECLPEETCQYGKHLFPSSDAAQRYSGRQLGMVAVPHHAIKQLARALHTEGEKI